MDVASSPYQRENDIDVELDSFREPSVLEDEMIDYQDDLADQNDALQDIPVDDDVMDQASTAGHEFDYNMDSSIQQIGDEDEDFLYEDEEELEAIPQQLEQDNSETQPHVDEEFAIVAEDADDETIDNAFDENINLQIDDDLVTQAPNSDASKVLTPTMDNQAYNHDPSDHNPPQSSAQSPSAHPERTLPEEDEEEVEEEDLPQTDSGNVRDDTLELHQENNPPPGAIGQDDAPLPEDSAQTTSDAQHEEVQESTDTHTDPTREVHPVTLVYLEEEMSLFPPLMGDESSVYFLSDPSLASQSLDKLLAACREILTGTLDHHDELVLDIPGLGLHICEDSKYSAQITLTNVLEVYLNLCHNDVDDACQTLYCHLSSRVSLASQYAYLSSAGAEGKTYAEIVADHIDTPEEGSLHADDEVYSPKVQETVVEATEHQLPVSSDVEVQAQLSKDDLDEQDGEEELFGQLDEDSLAQSVGVETLSKEQSDGKGRFTAQALDPSQNQEENADFGTLGDEVKEEDQDHSNHVHSPAAGSNSSHTVEALHDDIENPEGYDEDAGGEDLFDNANQDVDDLLNQQENEEYRHDYGHEELFAEPGVDPDVDAQPATLLSEETVNQSLSPTTERQPFENDAGDANLDFLDNEADAGIATLTKDQALVDPSPPITPSKPKVAKRKAEVDDDLDFLEIGTPEPKRRRPS